MHGMRIKSHRRPFVKQDLRNNIFRPFFFQAERKTTPATTADEPAVSAKPAVVVAAPEVKHKKSASKNRTRPLKTKQSKKKKK